MLFNGRAQDIAPEHHTFNSKLKSVKTEGIPHHTTRISDRHISM